MKINLGLPTIITLIFLVLKLTKNIDWSWWWVFSPIWITISVGFLFFFLVFLGMNSFESRKTRRW